MKKRIFLSDIDGTLLKGRGSIPEAVAEAARKFAETGWLCLCTGRSLASAEGIAGLLGVNAPSILLTGAELYDFQKKRAVWDPAHGGGYPGADCLGSWRDTRGLVCRSARKPRSITCA